MVSSQVSQVPQGVGPPAQLPRVPPMEPMLPAQLLSRKKRLEVPPPAYPV